MMPLSLALALMLVCEPGIPCKEMGEFWERWELPLASVSVALELMNEGELSFSGAFGTWSNMPNLRSRWQELKYAPALWERDRFPHWRSLKLSMEINRAYVQMLGQSIWINAVDEWQIRDAVQEADWLFNVYDACRESMKKGNSVYWKRCALVRLKGLIGDEDFAAGRLPLPVPLHRFTEFGD